MRAPPKLTDGFGLPSDPGLRRCLFGILTVGAALRVVPVLVAIGDSSVLFQPDSYGYMELAESFMRAYSFAPAESEVAATLGRPPGYPGFLAALGPFGGPLLVATIQACVATGTVYATFVVGRYVGGERVGVLAAGALAVEPASVAHAGLLLTETLFTALVVLASILTVALSLSSRDAEPSLALSLLLGLLLAASAFVRPTGLVVGLAWIGAVLLALAAAPASRRTRGAAILLLILGFSLPVASWVARNAAVADVAAFSTVDAVSLLNYKAAGALAESSGRSLVEVQDQLADEREREIGDDPPLARRYEYDRRHAIEVIASHPLGFFESWSKGALRLLGGPGRETITQLAGGSEGGRVVAGPLVAMSAVVVVSMLLLALIGVLRLLTGWPWRVWLPLLIVPGVLVVVSAGPEAYSRFRVPVAPYLAVFAALGVTWARSLMKRRVGT